MISVSEAYDIVLNNTFSFGNQNVELKNAYGGILGENVQADRDFPPFDRVTMDGIAVSWSVLSEGKTNFEIEGVAAAGAIQYHLKSEHNCVEVMTGAVLPAGTDTVIPYELLEISDKNATLTGIRITKGMNVHTMGSDHKKGDILLQSGTKITGAEMGVLSTVGKDKVSIHKFPEILILSSGDELVDISVIPEPHQIRSSNAISLHGILTSYGILPKHLHVRDDLNEIESLLREKVLQFDAIIISGGVSKGKFDFLPDALLESGVEKLFHRVAQRPGKPFWFGRHPAGTCVFAFPGNPVSAFMCMCKYFIPWLKKSIDTDIPAYFAKLEKDIIFKPDLTFFPVVNILCSQEGQFIAKPVYGKGSGDLIQLTRGNGFLELPADKTTFKAGEVYPVILYK